MAVNIYKDMPYDGCLYILLGMQICTSTRVYCLCMLYIFGNDGVSTVPARIYSRYYGRRCMGGSAVSTGWDLFPVLRKAVYGWECCKYWLGPIPGIKEGGVWVQVL